MPEKQSSSKNPKQAKQVSDRKIIRLKSQKDNRPGCSGKRKWGKIARKNRPFTTKQRDVEQHNRDA